MLFFIVENVDSGVSPGEYCLVSVEKLTVCMNKSAFIGIFNNRVGGCMRWEPLAKEGRCYAKNVEYDISVVVLQFALI